MENKRNHLPYGSRRRRWAQRLGFVFNDDGTWSPLYLKSEKGERKIAEEQAKYPRPEQPR